MRGRRGLVILSVGLLPLFVVAAPEARSRAMLTGHLGCSGYCHVPHSSGGPTLTRAAAYDLLCMTCHNPAAPVGAAPAADYHTQDPQDSNDGANYTFQVDCVECHLDAPHSNVTNAFGGTNLKLVRSSVTSPFNGVSYDIRLESLSGDHSFCDQDGPDPLWGENLCDMCHSDNLPGAWGAERHINDPVTGNTWGTSNHHRSGATCTGGNCHNHDRGFQLR